MKYNKRKEHVERIQLVYVLCFKWYKIDDHNQYVSIKSWRQRKQSEQNIMSNQLKSKINDDNSESWQIMSVRKTYMIDIQFRQIRKWSTVNNILDKKNRIRCSTTFHD